MMRDKEKWEKRNIVLKKVQIEGDEVKYFVKA